MSRDVLIYLEDMLEAASRVLRYTHALGRETVFADEKIVDAVLRNLEVLGEAAKHVPDEMRARQPSIDWRKIAGLRDVLAHEYFGIDQDILWDIIANKVPPLPALLEAVIREERTAADR